MNLARSLNTTSNREEILSIAPISIASSTLHLAGAVATKATSPPLESSQPTVPTYARPPSPASILSTTGSAVKGLLAAARDGSDLFLPLKAALVGVVALWDIWDVCRATSCAETC